VKDKTERDKKQDKSLWDFVTKDVMPLKNKKGLTPNIFP
jgi:hypothetical protein